MVATRINPHNIHGAGMDVGIKEATGEVTIRLVAHPDIAFTMSPEAALMLSHLIIGNCRLPDDGFYLAS